MYVCTVKTGDSAILHSKRLYPHQKQFLIKMSFICKIEPQNVKYWDFKGLCIVSLNPYPYPRLEGIQILVEFSLKCLLSEFLRTGITNYPHIEQFADDTSLIYKADTLTQYQ